MNNDGWVCSKLTIQGQTNVSSASVCAALGGRLDNPAAELSGSPSIGAPTRPNRTAVCFGLGAPPIGWRPCSSTVVSLPAHPGRRCAATPLRSALGCDRTAASRLKNRPTGPVSGLGLMQMSPKKIGNVATEKRTRQSCEAQQNGIDSNHQSLPNSGIFNTPVPTYGPHQRFGGG